jgi:hypothetical protein
MMKKEYLLSQGEETHHFKRRLSRRDTDERFHLSTTQDKVKNLKKAPRDK